MEFVNEAVFKIVRESEEVDNIMADVLLEMPKLFETLRFDTVRDVVVRYILDPKPFTQDTKLHEVFENILRRNLNGPIKVKTKKSQDVKIADKLRLNARLAMKNECKDKNFLHLLGCSQFEFRKHMESQFDETMTWDNYGMEGWHIDHIEPLCSFDLKTLDGISDATHFSNLRPLWAAENIAKCKASDKQKSIRRIK